MVFINDSELSYTASARLETALQYVMKEILKKNDIATYRTVYAVYTPSTYQETGAFGEAWETKTSSGQKSADGEFYFEPSHIVANVGVDPHQHADVDGFSVAEEMADIIYEGAMGCIYRPTKRNAWKVVDKWLSADKVKRLFEVGMNKANLKWVRSGGSVTKTSE